MTTATKLPGSFLAEVAAARAELADVAPRVLDLLALVADRYARVEATFNELVPRAERMASDEAWQPLWAQSGAQQLQDRVGDLAERVADMLDR